MICLHKLASIHSGYSLRNPYTKFQHPNVYWITPSHVIAQNFNQLSAIEVKLAKNITVVKPGDILLTNRVQFKAAVFAPSGTTPTLASAGIWIIRPTVTHIDSTFLAFWLNSEKGQQALKGIASKFATLHSIRKEDLANLALPNLPLTQQKKLANLYGCYIKQNSLQQQRFKLQLQLLEGLMASL